MLSLVDEAERVLTTKTDLNEFGRLLDYTWKLKRGISSGISTDSIDGLYAKGIEAGALGGKLLGAGGGGFLLFYVEEDKREAVAKAMEDLLYVPFQFENSGTQSDPLYGGDVREEVGAAGALRDRRLLGLRSAAARFFAEWSWLTSSEE